MDDVEIWNDLSVVGEDGLDASGLGGEGHDGCAVVDDGLSTVGAGEARDAGGSTFCVCNLRRKGCLRPRPDSQPPDLTLLTPDPTIRHHLGRKKQIFRHNVEVKEGGGKVALREKVAQRGGEGNEAARRV